MNYTQQNLPLSPRKVIKKSIANIFTRGSISAIVFISIIITYGYSYYWIRGIAETSGEIITPSFFSNLPVLLLSICLVYLAISIIYQYLYYKFYSYSFSDDSAEITKGVISKATGHVRYERLQNVYVDQDFWDRVFGLYDVHYETAGETSQFYSHVDGLPKYRADILTNFLLEKMKSGGTPSAPSTTTPPPSQSVPPQFQANAPEISSSTHPISKKVIYEMTISLSIVLIALSLLYFFLVPPASCHGIQRCDVSARYVTLLPFFMILWMIIVLLSYIYSVVWFRNFRYTLWQDRGEIITKVIAQNISYAYYDRIQNVDVNQSIIGRLFGLFAISIETAGETSGKALRIPGLTAETAGLIKNFLLEKSRKYRESL